jgi:hypothetical protein
MIDVLGRRFLALSAAAITFAAASASATEPPKPIAVGEIAESAGIDSAAVRATAEGELAEIDLSKLPAKRRVIVSLSVARSAVGDGVACHVNAMLRDAKSGAMIAIIETGAQAQGTTSDEAAKRVAHAAVRSAMRRIPTALGTK